MAFTESCVTMSRTHMPLFRSHSMIAGGLLMLLAFTLPSVQARTRNINTGSSSNSYLQLANTQAEPGKVELGQGEHAWRFVVRHPERPQEPYRRAGYQVRLPPGLKLPNGDTAVLGTTDAQGRTAIIRVQGDSEASDWVVLPTWGEGPTGTVVYYNDGQGNGTPDMPYALEVDTGAIYCGLSLPSGHSAYMMVPASHTILQRQMRNLEHCQAIQKVLNPLVRQSSMAARVAGLKRLLADPRWTDHTEMLADKLQANLLREGSQSDIERHVQEQLGEWGISKAEQAERLNGIAYAMLTMRPPRLLPLAYQLATQSVILNATPDNLDTQAWALHHMGRYEEALHWYAQALQGFLTMCKTDTQSAYLETMAHQAETLWALGRKDEAVKLWAEVARSDTRNSLGESWSTGLVYWHAAKAAIQTRVTEQEANSATVMLNCSERRDQP